MFGKLHKTAYTGSMYGAGPIIFSVWPWLIANANAEGEVECNPRFLGPVLGIDPKEVREALDYLQAPDEESRSKKDDGRRLIQTGEYEYQIVNYAQYRAIRDPDARKAYKREWMRQKRAKERGGPVDSKSPHVDSVDSVDRSGPKQKQKQKQRQKHKGSSTPPTPPRKRGGVGRKAEPAKPSCYEELRDYGLEIGLPKSECQVCFDYWESAGWKRKSGPVKDWKATVRVWASKWKKDNRNREEVLIRRGIKKGTTPEQDDTEEARWADEQARLRRMVERQD